MVVEFEKQIQLSYNITMGRKFTITEKQVKLLMKLKSTREHDHFNENFLYDDTFEVSDEQEFVVIDGFAGTIFIDGESFIDFDNKLYQSSNYDNLLHRKMLGFLGIRKDYSISDLLLNQENLEEMDDEDRIEEREF